MSTDGNGQFSSGLILNPISLGGTMAGGGGAPPSLLGNFPMGHTPQNAPMPGAAPGALAQKMPQPSVLKVAGLPSDISQREAGLMFSLVLDDVLSIDLNEHDLLVCVAFKTPSTCLTAGRLLDGKYIFGQSLPPVKVEYDASQALSGASAAFDNMRLSNAGISPPSSLSVAAQPPHHAPAGQPHAAQLQPGSGAPGMDNFQKRPSIGNQRSRFLFSDPFSGSTTPTNGAPGSIDLSDLTGKSLLLMKPSDGREYDAMLRDPWAAQSQGNIGFSSNPQTPGLSTVHGSYDWGAGAAGTLPASASASSQAHAPPHTQQAPLQPGHAPAGSSQMPFVTTLAPADRRRTSSFFNGHAAHVAAQSPVGHDSQGQQQLTPQKTQPSPSAQALRQHEQQHQQQPQHPAPPTVASIISQGPTQQLGGAMPSLTMPAGRTPASSGPQASSLQLAGSAQPSAATPTGARPMQKDVPDLSLLARVPPPANPADQNPPCNTLYVGNLPPDATETELRSLFSPQKGFRRLSFRTKNQPSGSGGGSSSHNHGPMCFVEFEDVAHATVALAELYGRALPRPVGNNTKGGIRLSFSKNPLGVRGPGNPRRASANPQPSLSSGSNNGVGNYGYLNYH
ncbi:hypothetical protein METBIDRAFT_117069 [Metschnikowia bicuspidata var. bicuspidata NRRL YB-4993]|uniref:RRM domain-containing protein n=1 Tax=Metschnikowia bicuspidata var. bicuspidata NRRL YB-4993 TaxID=869754 RepID=A0A1A0HJT2_9ASCO|nr:hypothetical protein METBIDRAFT_117069 [Metschnikowia bicuspidata var. bicuspidata NRRL YB-4993]OBA24073.1 hypothetical protein METBIDRAFT_117069 [Metschnikowia bicuspidata var. bicuspidata NRRL YB-4993]